MPPDAPIRFIQLPPKLKLLARTLVLTIHIVNGGIKQGGLGMAESNRGGLGMPESNRGGLGMRLGMFQAQYSQESQMRV